jgi:putative ABC transport system substrate-binding protein
VVSRDYVDLGQQAAAVVVRILDGADPATIPFQDPVGSRLLLNEATARTLGLTIPESILRETDERIAE